MMRRIAVAITLCAWSAVLAGCGGTDQSSSSSGGGGGSSGGVDTSICPTNGSSSGSFSGQLKIGSKAFSEEELLAQMTKDILEKAGFKVDYSFKAKDPAINQALQNGTIDMYWQYTGTALQQYLGVDKPPTDLDQAFSLAQQKDQANSICWTSKAGFNDTNGLAIKSSDKGKYGSTLSDLAKYLQSNPNTKVCIESEFRTRADGAPGLQQTYGIPSSLPGYVDIGTSTAEKLIASGSCEVGEVFTTDAGIAANNLLVLKDDKGLFPPDNVGLLIRSNVLKQHPEIAALVAPLAQKLDTDTMTKLNKLVDVDGQKVEDVAKNFLQQNGLL